MSLTRRLPALALALCLGSGTAHSQEGSAFSSLQAAAGGAFVPPPAPPDLEKPDFEEAARSPASVLGEPPQGSAADYLELTDRLKTRGLSFNDLFAALARHLEEHPPAWTGSPDRDCVRARAALGSLFLGAFRSALKDKASGLAFQDRHDWVLHFLAGGLAAVASQETAFDQAYAKEASDALDPKNFFDIGDLGATLYGARWVAGAGFDFRGLFGRARPGAAEVFTAWVHAWASGERRLDGLPKLYPILPAFGREPGQLPAAELASFDDVAPALGLVKLGMDHEGSVPWPDEAFMRAAAEKSEAAYRAGQSRSWWAWTHPRPKH